MHEMLYIKLLVYKRTKRHGAAHMLQVSFSLSLNKSMARADIKSGCLVINLRGKSFFSKVTENGDIVLFDPIEPLETFNLFRKQLLSLPISLNDLKQLDFIRYRGLKIENRQNGLRSDLHGGVSVSRQEVEVPLYLKVVLNHEIQEHIFKEETKREGMKELKIDVFVNLIDMKHSRTEASLVYIKTDSTDKLPS